MSGTLNYKVYIENPAAEWVVFLHGAGGSIQTWNFQLNAFKKQHYNILLIDLRGHGKSKNIRPAYSRYNFDIVSNDIIRVLDEEHIRKAHFVTLSFGSVMMQALYKRRPGLVRRMVFIGGIFNANWRIKSFVHLARFLNLLLSYRRMYQVFSYLLIPKKEHQFARRVYWRQAGKLGAKEYLKWLGLYGEFFLLLRSFQRQPINHPMLILMGEDDYIFLPGAYQFAGKKVLAELKLIRNAGHICNIDKPAATNRAILNFLGNPGQKAKKQRTKAPSDTSLH